MFLANPLLFMKTHVSNNLVSSMYITGQISALKFLMETASDNYQPLKEIVCKVCE